MDVKIIFSIIATIIGIIGFIPYLKDIFLKKTKPHAYTWLVWTITQGTAVAAMWYGGSGLGAMSLTITLLLVFGVFLISFKYGTKNITKSDTFILIIALSAVIAWWLLNQPLISVIMVSIIDFLGYIPSFRKTYQEPWSETLSSWLIFAFSNIIAILAFREYSFLTMTYISTLTIANLMLFLVSFIRRFKIQRPIK